jgi:glycerol-3-phosphate acyltransferase PlsX
VDILPVALDAMGGDFAPSAVIKGAEMAADSGIKILLTGPGEIIENAGKHKNIELQYASEVISMYEDPAKAVRTKKDSSLVVAAQCVKEKRASSMVSAGNTGAAMAAALFRMGRIKKIARPAIATTIPVIGRHPAVLIDSGANADCKSQWLVQFAQMACIYVKKRYGLSSVKVALLSIGEESSKGNLLVKETRELLSKINSFEFIGNVEGRDLLEPPADVIVCDGFTGNVALKALEGSLKFFMNKLLEIFNKDEQTKKAAEILFPHLLPLAEELNPESTGGAALLGVDGICIISHGSSSEKAIFNACKLASDLAKADIVSEITEEIEG